MDRWQIARRQQEKAIELAETTVSSLGLEKLPIEPGIVANSEAPLLVVKSGDYRSRFDGQLEYHRKQNRFLLFYNTKHDDPLTREHHPRTRFSFAHELGHYFIERHRVYLMKGGPAHGSRSEFLSDVNVEREADSFAAGLLMPSRLMRPLVNASELSFRRVREIAGLSKTSLVSTMIRSVSLSDFPCAAVGIREETVAWSFLSPPLLEAGCYPLPGRSQMPASGRRLWDQIVTSPRQRHACDGLLSEWFQTYDRDSLSELLVHVEARWIGSMSTLLVLLTADEDDLAGEDEE